MWLLTIWLLNQTVPAPIIPSISIPVVGERDGGEGRQKRTGQKPRHDSPTKHRDPVGCSPGMHVVIHHAHLNPPFVILLR